MTGVQLSSSIIAMFPNPRNQGVASCFAVMTYLLAATRIVQGYPSGAPTSTCASLNPEHGSSSKSISSSPYRLTLRQDTYQSGVPLTGEMFYIVSYNMNTGYTCVQHHSPTDILISIHVRCNSMVNDSSRRHKPASDDC